MQFNSISRSATMLAFLAVLSLAPAAHAEDPATTSPTGSLGDIVDCLVEALNGDAAGTTLLASNDGQATITLTAAGAGD
jgi:hypothetical protein